MSKYAELGVDVKKKGIEVFHSLLNNLFPSAFSVISQDPNFPDYFECMHTDGVGSKPIQCYLNWKETSEIDWFKGLSQDAIAMNINDIICVGALNSPIFVDYIALNPLRLPKEGLLRILYLGFKECIEELKKNGVNLRFAGGETADLPDQLRTLDVSGAIHAKIKKSEIVTGRKIKEDDFIIGLKSGGKTKYEKKENSGIMCNFITLARHSLLEKVYEEKYPEIKEQKGLGYYGRFRFDDYVDELGMTIGDAIISPTRLYAPIIQRLLKKFHFFISGLIHNTGGGLTKCLKLSTNIHFIKNDLPNPDAIFYLIQKESKESWRNMYMGGNMGVGFEIIVDPEIADDVLDLLESFNLGAQIIGICKKSKEGNKLTIQSSIGKFQYF
jgi:phosphoribosylformylglycinamidine cyclo-ligase